MFLYFLYAYILYAGICSQVYRTWALFDTFILDMQDFDKCYKKGSILSTKSELRKNLDEEKLERKQELDILSRWKIEQFHYPVISRLTCDALTILVSTVTSESIFRLVLE